MPTQKDTATELFRKKLCASSELVETEYADSGLTTLSFQSILNPNRNIWIDTDSAGECVLDLEDWSDDSQWDNSVAHAISEDMNRLAEIALAWLKGKPLEECKAIDCESVQWKV